jgi:hypothetical protein
VSHFATDSRKFSSLKEIAEANKKRRDTNEGFLTPPNMRKGLGFVGINS